LKKYAVFAVLTRIIDKQSETKFLTRVTLADLHCVAKKLHPFIFK